MRHRHQRGLPGLPLFVVLLLAAASASARAIHFDSDSGSDARSGARPELARRTFGDWRWAVLQPGDSLLFKRGGSWLADSLILSGEGTAERPIVLSAYGDPSLPLPRLENAGLLVVLHDMRHVVVEDLDLAGARDACLQLADSSVADATVRRVEAHGCGGGIRASGTRIALLDNVVRDGRMVVNTPDVFDDYYGATGITLERIDGCVARGNRMRDLVAPSWDYGVDGGAFEFWKTVRRCEIVGNFAWRTDGFAEFGGQAGDSVVDVTLHHNVALETGLLACLHVRSAQRPFGVAYDSVRIDNNLAVSRGRPAWSNSVVADGGLLDRPGRVRVRNNVFAFDSASDFSWQEGSESDPSWSREANLVWNPFHDPFATDRVRGPGEIYADPGFRNAAWIGSADTGLAGFLPGLSSPASGTGLDLGYSLDFFGVPAAPGGVVDRGPFAHGSSAAVRSRSAFRASPMRIASGTLLVEPPSSGATTVDVALAGADGRILTHVRGTAAPGAPCVAPLPPEGGVLFARARWSGNGGGSASAVFVVPQRPQRCRRPW